MTDPQDPLPEGRWLYRRLFTWGLTIFACGLLAFIVHKLEGDAPALQSMFQWTIGLIALLATYYLIAPSAEQLAKIVASMKLFREQPDLAPTRPRYRAPRRSYEPVGREMPDDPDGGV